MGNDVTVTREGLAAGREGQGRTGRKEGARGGCRFRTPGGHQGMCCCAIVGERYVGRRGVSPSFLAGISISVVCGVWVGE